MQDRKHLVPWLDSSHHGGKKQASTFGCPGYLSQTVHSCKYNLPDMTIYTNIKAYQNHQACNNYSTWKIHWQNVVSKNVTLICIILTPIIHPWWSLLHQWHLSSAFAHRRIHRTLPDQSAQAAETRGKTAYLATGKGPQVPVQTLHNKSLELLANSGNKISTYINVSKDIWR